MFQSRGAGQLKALNPLIVRQAVGTVRCRKEEDLRVQEEVATWRRSDRYGGVRLWMALNTSRRILKLMWNFSGSQ